MVHFINLAKKVPQIARSGLTRSRSRLPTLYWGCGRLMIV